MPDLRMSLGEQSRGISIPSGCWGTGETALAGETQEAEIKHPLLSAWLQHSFCLLGLLSNNLL